MNRSVLSLVAVVTGLAAVSGVAVLHEPEDSGPAPAAARLPVERTTLLCPPPSLSDLAETQYTALTPVHRDRDGAAKRSADLLPAPVVQQGGADADGEKDGKGGRDGAAKPVLSSKKPGVPVVAGTSDSAAPALTGSAEGPLAPGWTVQQTTLVSNGHGRGLLGTACSTPDTEFWFPGASTAQSRQDYVHLTNPDSTTAVVDLHLVGKDGPVDNDRGEGIQIPAHSAVPVLLSTLTEEPMVNVSLQVKARTGRVGAQVQAADATLGSDWLPRSAEPSSRVVLPGIPQDATSVRLVVHATGDRDADLQVRLAGESGTITPAGHETLHVRGESVLAVDLNDLTRGEPGSLLLSPAGDSGETGPVVAALRVTRGEEEQAREIAFIPGTDPLTERATVADNRSKGSTLSLMAPGKDVKVRVTASAGSGGGRSTSETYTVKGGTTRAVQPPVPDGLKGRYGLTVERLSGGELYAARTLGWTQGGIPMFTVQTLPDDRGTVTVPRADQDLSVLMD